MKKLLLSLIFMSGNLIAGGIPTADLVGLANSQLEFLEQTAHWAKQLEQYKKDYQMFEQQYRKAQDQYNAISGIRDLSSAMNYFNSLSWTLSDLNKWLSDPDKILEAGFDSLTPELRTKVTELGFANMCNYTNSNKSDYYQYQLRKNCEGRVVLNILQTTKYQKAIKLRELEDKKFEEKLKELTTTQDTKESADNTNALLGMLIQQQVKTQRMIEDQQAQETSREAQALKEEAIFKASMQAYKKREVKW